MGQPRAPAAATPHVGSLAPPATLVAGRLSSPLTLRQEWVTEVLEAFSRDRGYWSRVRGPLYCWSVTGSAHVVSGAPSSVPSHRAMCSMNRSGTAPCQCSSSGGHATVSPGWASKTVPSRVPISAMPDTTCRVWPTAWECQLVRAPGEKRTRLARIRDGAWPATMTSHHTSPVNQSAGALLLGCGLMNSMVSQLSLLR